MTVSIEVKDEQVNELFSKLLNKMKNLQPVFQDIGEIIYNSIRKNFRNESDPKGNKWTELTQRTIMARESRHPGSPIHILHETGNLETSIHTKATNKDVRIGTSVNYAKTMQLGDVFKHIPARPFLGVKSSDWTEIEMTIKEYILG